MKKTTQSRWPAIISLTVVAGLVGAYFSIPDFQDFLKRAYFLLTKGDKQEISAWVNQLGAWGPVILALAMTLQMFLFVIPSPLLIVVSVLAYGAFWGAVISTFSVALASSVGYFIGRYLGETAVDKLIGKKKEEKIRFYVEKYGVWAIITVRLSPLLSNDAVSFIGGLVKMGYWKFIGATLAGIVPLTALIGYFGANTQRLKNGLIWFSAVSLVLLVVYIIYDRKKKPYKPAQ